MITYKEVRWGNAFSYGNNNVLKLNAAPLTQLVGRNGFGKSSIALILEEVQFNTNSKDVKKGKILNRYTKDKSYWIELDFDKDSIPYTIKTTRTNTTSKVEFYRDGEDISSHTATGTYKQIEEVLGYDHKTFSQIVYQSSVASLEFLTATDTTRKKFLVELLNLSKYTNAHLVFKALVTELTKIVDTESAKVDTIKAWLAKYEKTDLTPIELKAEPILDTNLNKQLVDIQANITNASKTNKAIEKNNTYKKMLDSIVLEPWTKDVPNESQYIQCKTEVLDIDNQLRAGKSVVTKGACKVTKCPTCAQDIDNSTHYTLAEQFKVKEATLNARKAELASTISKYETLTKQYEASQLKTREFEKYTALYDASLPDSFVDADELKLQVSSLEKQITSAEAIVLEIRSFNKKAAEHNSKVAVISGQIVEMKEELAAHSAKLTEAQAELSDLQVLVKAFSTTGLLAYKIECLVKDLEVATNEYLAEMADGRFQLTFQIASADKLNVVITDNGNETDLSSLSMGERARVNISALLAIRKLMQALSNSRTNLLFLDETISNLDAEGKEKLVEVLLGEPSLNTFIVSHDFTHALLDKINVIKENNISRLE